MNDILRLYWDPIGVEGLPEDEYAQYAAQVYVLLMDRNLSSKEIAQYLYDVAIGRMGLTPYAGLAERCRHAAELIAAQRSAFTTH